jgi:hypothetical protein
MNYVAFNLRGRLGNHLFQVAAVTSYAKEHNLIPVFIWDNTKNEAKSISEFLSSSKIVNASFIESFEILEHNHFNYVKIPEIQQSTLLKGDYCFFQDVNYLNRNLTLALFELPSLKLAVLEKYEDIAERTSIHVRRGDFVKREKIGSNQFVIPGLRYYLNALKICGSDKLIIFSDDINWCKNRFKFKNVIFSDDDEEFSIIAMSMCKNNIISASTFGWWGAYLNSHANKKVVAPKSWFKPNASEVLNRLTSQESNLIHDSWIRLDTHESNYYEFFHRIKKIRRSIRDSIITFLKRFRLKS